MPLFFDILIKVFKFMFSPSDDQIFQVYEKDMKWRKLFEQSAYKELFQGWTFPRDPSTTKTQILKLLSKIGINVDLKPGKNIELPANEDELYSQSALNRKERVPTQWIMNFHQAVMVLVFIPMIINHLK